MTRKTSRFDDVPEDVAPRRFRGRPRSGRKGLLIVYTGSGKGKSTAAFGAAFRALGRGLRVAVVQFIKGRWMSGEIKALERFGTQVDYWAEGKGFTWETKNLKEDVASARRGWRHCVSLLRAKRHDLYVFDELNYVLKYRFLTIDEVLTGLARRSPVAHVILTGRDAPAELIAAADLVTEMREIKHPYKRGITAQAGIDY